LVITSTACVAKRTTTDTPADDADRIAALETKVSQLQSKIASLPDSSGNYDKDIDNLYAEIESISEELDNVLIEVDTMLADWEESQATNTSDNSTDTTDAIDVTTRWSLDAWTGHDSYSLLDIYLDSKKIEDADDYTVWLLLYNKNHATVSRLSTTPNPLAGLTTDYFYYTTDTKKLWKATSATAWTEIPETNFASIYQPIEIKEITIEFSPKSSDRVVVDESRTELYSSGYPSFDWSMDFKKRADGTCKRMEAITDVKFTLPVPSKFNNNDPEDPCFEEFKLEFELAYK